MFPTPPRVKICCIQSDDEAAVAIRFGASAIGLVSAMPSGPGPIEESRIRDIAQSVPPGVATFLLTCKTSADAIIDQQRYCATNTLQLVDEVDTATYQQLRDSLPGIAIVQVIHVRDESAIDEAVRAAPYVNAILLDSGNPKAAVKELGGTGRRHDWSISRRLRDATDVPVYLAGGLNPTNVAEAVQTVQPFGVDVCSGLRNDGRLDEKKLQAFMIAVAGAL
jgi:phosphoribosylanthranilate isomerase